MIIRRGDIRVSGFRGAAAVAEQQTLTIDAGRSLVESNDKKRMIPVRAGGHQRHERLKKSIALSGRAVVHAIGHIRDDHGKVDGRVSTCERLNIWKWGSGSRTLSKLIAGLCFRTYCPARPGPSTPPVLVSRSCKGSSSALKRARFRGVKTVWPDCRSKLKGVQ